jgi:hypothetical protein
MSNELQKFIEKNQSLFWYTPKDKLDGISDSLLVETILNYGSLEDIKELFKIKGINNVANIFFHDINLSERRKGNYFELVINFFTLYFNRYAQRNLIRKAS